MSDNPWERIFRLDSKGQLLIRSARRTAAVLCSRPGCKNRDNIDDPKYKKCARCKGAFYCSKECQKLHWPTHKKTCNTNPESGSANDSLQNLGSNLVLQCLFQLIAIYMFRLHLLDEDSLRAVSSNPLELIVVVQHEPFQLKDFLQLFDIAALDREEAVAGMPQVVAVSTRREEDMIPSHIESWRESRKLHADFTAKGEYPTVLLTIKQMAAGPGTMFAVTELTIGITIVERMMSHVKHPENSPLDTMPTPTGNIDTDVKNAVQSLNELIRFDVINFFRLRVRLSRLEKVMISLASVSFPEDDATSTTPLIQEILERAFNCPGRQPMLDPPSRVYIQMLQKKIARERIYRSAVTYSGPELEGARRDILAQHIDSAEEQPVPEVWSCLLEA